MSPASIAIICMSAVVLVAVMMCAYVLHQTMRMTHDVKRDYVELLSRAIDNLKAQSLQERVEANALEKESDVRVEMLKDALKMEQDLLREKVEDPTYARASDGRDIDLRDYEIV